MESENDTIHREAKIPGTSDYISFNDQSIINEQKENSICKIIKDDGSFGTGFLCLIPFPDKLHPLPVLITCYHVLGINDIKSGNKIKMIFNDNIEKFIILDN